MTLLEGVGDVLEEDEAEHDVLVLGGVHVGAQRVGGLPQLALKAEVRAVAIGLDGLGFLGHAIHPFRFRER